MQVIHRLAAVAAAVNHDAVTAVEFELFCQVADHEPDVGDQVRVVIGDRGDRFDRALGITSTCVGA